MGTSTTDYANIVTRHPVARESLIPILQEIQEAEGYVSREGIKRVAQYLRLPSSKIYGVATFYNQFKLTPPGRHQIQICRGTACHVRGSLNLLETLEIELGIGPGETSADGLFSLEIVACLGACSIAPVMTIDGDFFGRLDKKKLAAAIDGIRNKEMQHA
jgi:NADH-quinone oxidoreductase subunit E